MGFAGGGEQEDTQGSRIPGQRQGHTRLDCALTVPAPRLGKKQPALLLRRGPCSESSPSIMAGGTRLWARHVTPHHPLNNPISHEDTESHGSDVTCLKWQALRGRPRFLLSACLAWKLPNSRCLRAGHCPAVAGGEGLPAHRREPGSFPLSPQAPCLLPTKRRGCKVRGTEVRAVPKPVHWPRALFLITPGSMSGSQGLWPRIGETMAGPPPLALMPLNLYIQRHSCPRPAFRAGDT